MNEIKSMFLEPVAGTNPTQYKICVVFTDGHYKLYDPTVENIASMNAWIAYLLTIAQGYAPKQSLVNVGPK